MPRRLFVVTLTLLAICAAQAAWAELRLPAIFGDNMVLQRAAGLPVWGWEQPGTQVTVEFGGTKATTVTAANGGWQVILPAQVQASAAPRELVVKSSTGGSKTFKNVLVGEVWIGSGQSNMQMTVKSSLDSDKEIPAAKYPTIRLFTVKQATADQPQVDCEGQWVECSPETVGPFSAVGYFYSRFLHQQLKVPVGFINTSWGGTPAEAWTSREALRADARLWSAVERWDQQVADYPQVKDRLNEAYQKQLANWKTQVEKAKAAKKPIPRRPNPPTPPERNPHRPANLYNAMLAPLVPLAIKGAVWYQGESNVTRACEYQVLFPLMIKNWRQVWRMPAMPFGLVQLAPYHYNFDPAWMPELREAQTMATKLLANVGMAVTTDIGDVKDIHPKNKQEVGRRLGLWALATVYGQKVVYSGPMYRGMSIENGRLRIHFTHVGGGLVTRDGKAPTDFTIAGADQRFYPADAAIEGETVVVSSPAVAKPVAVRFAWNQDAEPNLANKEGLPAVQFKTDTWPWLTCLNTPAMPGAPGMDRLLGANSPLKPGDRIAFLGDSITQGGASPNGYVWQIDDGIARRKPELKAEVIKAGISGNRVPNLLARVDRDVISKKPTAVFVYIGINDVWHSLQGRGTPKDEYEAGLKKLVEQLQQTGATVVLATPSTIGERSDGSNPLDKMLDEYAAISRKVAAERKVPLCDLRRAFVDFEKRNNPQNVDRGILTTDGVHLNAAGNRFVADQAAGCLADALQRRK